MAFRIDVSTGSAAAEQRQVILDGLREFNVSRAGPGNWEPLCVAAIDEHGAVEGGLYGHVSYDWLVIELLFVPEHMRGAGLGAQLIAEAEQQARMRGCIGAWLDTFDFQAPGFYQKLGFLLIGTIPDHPVGSARHFMAKRWG